MKNNKQIFDEIIYNLFSKEYDTIYEEHKNKLNPIYQPSQFSYLLMNMNKNKKTITNEKGLSDNIKYLNVVHDNNLEFNLLKTDDKTLNFKSFLANRLIKNNDNHWTYVLKNFIDVFRNTHTQQKNTKNLMMKKFDNGDFNLSDKKLCEDSYLLEEVNNDSVAEIDQLPTSQDFRRSDLTNDITNEDLLSLEKFDQDDYTSISIPYAKKLQNSNAGIQSNQNQAEYKLFFTKKAMELKKEGDDPAKLGDLKQGYFDDRFTNDEKNEINKKCRYIQDRFIRVPKGNYKRKVVLDKGTIFDPNSKTNKDALKIVYDRCDKKESDSDKYECKNACNLILEDKILEEREKDLQKLYWGLANEQKNNLINSLSSNKGNNSGTGMAMLGVGRDFLNDINKKDNTDLSTITNDIKLMNEDEDKESSNNLQTGSSNQDTDSSNQDTDSSNQDTDSSNLDTDSSNQDTDSSNQNNDVCCDRLIKAKKQEKCKNKKFIPPPYSKNFKTCLEQSEINKKNIEIIENRILFLNQFKENDFISKFFEKIERCFENKYNYLIKGCCYLGYSGITKDCIEVERKDKILDEMDISGYNYFPIDIDGNEIKGIKSIKGDKMEEYHGIFRFILNENTTNYNVIYNISRLTNLVIGLNTILGKNGSTSIKPFQYNDTINNFNIKRRNFNKLNTTCISEEYYESILDKKLNDGEINQQQKDKLLNDFIKVDKWDINHIKINGESPFKSKYISIDNFRDFILKKLYGNFNDFKKHWLNNLNQIINLLNGSLKKLKKTLNSNNESINETIN